MTDTMARSDMLEVAACYERLADLHDRVEDQADALPGLFPTSTRPSNHNRSHKD